MYIVFVLNKAFLKIIFRVISCNNSGVVVRFHEFSIEEFREIQRTKKQELVKNTHYRNSQKKDKTTWKAGRHNLKEKQEQFKKHI